MECFLLFPVIVLQISFLFFISPDFPLISIPL